HAAAVFPPSTALVSDHSGRPSLGIRRTALYLRPALGIVDAASGARGCVGVDTAWDDVRRAAGRRVRHCGARARRPPEFPQCFLAALARPDRAVRLGRKLYGQPHPLARRRLRSERRMSDYREAAAIGRLEKIILPPRRATTYLVNPRNAGGSSSSAHKKTRCGPFHISTNDACVSKTRGAPANRTHASRTTIIATSATFPAPARPRRRRIQLASVLSRNASEKPNNGTRNAPIACGVKSRKCPNESA